MEVADQNQGISTFSMLSLLERLLKRLLHTKAPLEDADRAATHENLEQRLLLSTEGGAEDAPDLVGEFGQTTFPPAIVVGDQITARVPVTISNLGEVAVKTKIDIAFYASPTGVVNDPGNIELSTVENRLINLGPGASRDITFRLTLPDTLSSGVCTLIGQLDVDGDLAESDETNNDIISNATVVVGDPFVDVVGGVNETVAVHSHF